jgi:hypothetical protein
MDKAKLIQLLYEVLPYVQKWERDVSDGKEKTSLLLGNSVSLKVWEAIKTLEKWEGA